MNVLRRLFALFYLKVSTGLARDRGIMNSDSDLSLDQVISEVLALFRGSTVIVDARIVDDGRSATDPLKDEGVYEDYLAWSNAHIVKRKYARRRGPCQE
jgi:hypothetical protein